MLDLGISISVVGLSFPVCLPLGDAFGFRCVCKTLLCLVLLLLLALFEDLHVCLELHIRRSENFVESGPLLLLFYFAAEFLADFHGGRVPESLRHLARLRVLLQNELVDRLLRQIVEADHHLVWVLRCRRATHHGECHAWRRRLRVRHRGRLCLVAAFGRALIDVEV